LVNPGLSATLGVVGAGILNGTSGLWGTSVVPLVSCTIFGDGHGSNWDTTLLVGDWWACGAPTGGEIDTGADLPSVNPLLVDNIDGTWETFGSCGLADGEGWGLALGSEDPCALFETAESTSGSLHDSSLHVSGGLAFKDNHISTDESPLSAGLEDELVSSVVGVVVTIQVGRCEDICTSTHGSFVLGSSGTSSSVGGSGGEVVGTITAPPVLVGDVDSESCISIWFSISNNGIVLGWAGPLVEEGTFQGSTSISSLSQTSECDNFIDGVAAGTLISTRQCWSTSSGTSDNPGSDLI
jgi:hypothetical protein